MKFLEFITIAIIVYLIFSFINAELNPIHWNIFSKIIYVIGAIISLDIDD